MNLSAVFIRSFLLVLSVLLTTAFALSVDADITVVSKLQVGLGAGVLFGLLVMGMGFYFERFTLRAFNLVTLGLLLGFLMGRSILLVVESVITISGLPVDPLVSGFASSLIYLICIYLSTLLVVRSDDSVAASIPLVQLQTQVQKRRDLVVDNALLLDARVLDIANSGLIDNSLIVPRYLVSELLVQAESEDEAIRGRAKRALEVLKKLEGIPDLGMRFTEINYADIKDPMLRLVRIARQLNANVLTADISRLQQSEVEGVRIINIHTLAGSLKPVAQAGEHITIKVQRYGKEPLQGVGYLEDGTMVVINGGAEFIGETIRARVLSVKYTKSGRMIFCNATEDMTVEGQPVPAGVGAEPGLAPHESPATKKYFSV
jgi:uncharacterized protein YacL